MARLRDPALGRKVKEEPDLMTALSKVRPLRSPTHSLRSQRSIPNDGRMCDGQHTPQAYVRLKLGGDQG